MQAGECPTILVTIDGLRAAALGPYGQTAYETPAFDALAVESETFDWCYAPAADRLELLESVARRFVGATLVTDDRAWIDAAGRGTLVEVPAPSSNATAIEASSTAAVWSAFAESLADCSDLGHDLWFHAKGMHGVWDGPAELWAPLVDEEDPPVEPSVETPFAEFGDPQSDAACDARFAAACRYAGEVMTLDACLAAWIDVFDAAFEGEDVRLLIAGLRGFALGEHGRIGPDERLFSESQHTPLLVRHPDQSRRFTRNRRPQAVLDALDSVLAGAPDKSSARLGSAAADAVVTEDWMVRRPRDGRPELYVKPDDRWEQNDVASLEEAIATELLSRLAPPADVGTSTAKAIDFAPSGRPQDAADTGSPSDRWDKDVRCGLTAPVAALSRKRSASPSRGLARGYRLRSRRSGARLASGSRFVPKRPFLGEANSRSTPVGWSDFSRSERSRRSRRALRSSMADSCCITPSRGPMAETHSTSPYVAPPRRGWYYAWRTVEKPPRSPSPPRATHHNRPPSKRSAERSP